MAPAYKLTYFAGRGIAEPARFLMIYGGIEFEDVRIKLEEWPAYKSKTPFGQLPFLEHNDKQVNQSIPICRYLAKQVKLTGKDDWENLEIDAIVDTFNDVRAKISVIYWEKDEAKKQTMKDTAVKETIPFYLSRLEAIAKKNNGHLVGGKLTWADIYVASMAPTFDYVVGANAYANYPNLKAIRDTVEAIPAIKKWIETRPKTEFFWYYYPPKKSNHTYKFHS